MVLILTITSFSALCSSSIMALFCLWALILLMKFLTTGDSLLPMLLTLEAVMLTTLLTMALVLSFPSNVLLLFFTLSVCEACLGLGALISVLRYQGSDQIYS